MQALCRQVPGTKHDENKTASVKLVDEEMYNEIPEKRARSEYRVEIGRAQARKRRRMKEVDFVFAFLTLRVLPK
jgi:hypothetical protein